MPVALCLLSRNIHLKLYYPTLQSRRGKRLVLRIIGALAENEANRIQIGRQEGFKAILRLLVLHDASLTREVLRTLKRFLDFSLAGGTDNADATIEQANTNVHMLAEVGKMAPWFSNWVASAERVDKSLSRTSGKSWAAAASVAARASTDDLPAADRSHPAGSDFPPRKETLEELAREVLKEDRRIVATITTTTTIAANTPSSAADDDHSHDSSSKEEQDQSSQSTEVSTEDLRMNVNAKAVAAADKLFQEFMRVQGALPTLVNMLKQKDNSKQELLEVMGTIRMLLLRNKLMQTEIIQLDGYSAMIDVPERLVDLDFLPSEKELARSMKSLVSESDACV